MNGDSPLPTTQLESPSTPGEADWMLEHVDWLRRLIDRRVHPLDCGDEVLQEVLVAASQSDSLPSHPEQRAPWLARVAIRQSALALRSWCRRKRREAEYVSVRESIEDPLAHDPIYALLLSEKREFVREQLTRLDPQQRELLVLKYVTGCSYQEIADRLGMEVTTVEYRLTQARKTLRRSLVDAGLGESVG